MTEDDLIVGRKYAFLCNDEGPHVGRLKSVSKQWAVFIVPVAFGTDNFCVRHSSVIGPVAESGFRRFFRNLWESL